MATGAVSPPLHLIDSKQHQSEQPGSNSSYLDSILQQRQTHNYSRCPAACTVWPCHAQQSPWPHARGLVGQLHAVQGCLVHGRSMHTAVTTLRSRQRKKHKSLAVEAPVVAASWDYKRNSGTPEDYTAGSNYEAMWNCQDCGLSWQAIIKQRALGGTGCPHCYGLRGGRKADGSRTSHPTLRGASGDHSLMAEWDKDANEKAGLHPEKIKLRSRIPVNWVCCKCPSGLLHLYKAMPNDRTLKCSGCPYCDGQKACTCNSLQTHFPDLVEEWDFDRNKGNPEDYTAGSNKSVWWKTAKRGSWQQTIHSRTDSRLKRHQHRAPKQ